MHLFPALALPLGSWLLYLAFYPAESFAASRRACALGALFSPLAWIGAGLLKALVPAWYGSPLLAFHEWAGRLLPWAVLPSLGYALFHRLGERLPPGDFERRVTAFYAGCLAPLMIAALARDWGRPGLYLDLLLAPLAASLALAAPRALRGVIDDFGARRVLRVLLFALACLAASTPRWFVLAGLWPIAVVLTLGACAISWLYAAPSLARRAPAAPGAA